MRLTPLAGAAIPASGRLEALVDDVWERIARALDGRWPPWGLPTLATVAHDGARARVLALRGASREARTFVFHADARSDKIGEIEAESRVSVVFWDPADGIEARFIGTARVHHGDVTALAAWENVSSLRRLSSRMTQPPGASLREAQRFETLPALDGADGSANFAVIDVVASGLDWLWVGADDIRRASFTWTGTHWAGAWTVP